MAESHDGVTWLAGQHNDRPGTTGYPDRSVNVSHRIRIASGTGSLHGVMQFGQLHTPAQKVLTCAVVSGTDRIVGESHGCVLDRIEVNDAGTGTLGKFGQQARVSRNVGGRRTLPNHQPVTQYIAARRRATAG